jgi:hypothetical protein
MRKLVEDLARTFEGLPPTIRRRGLGLRVGPIRADEAGQEQQQPRPVGRVGRGSQLDQEQYDVRACLVDVLQGQRPNLEQAERFGSRLRIRIEQALQQLGHLLRGAERPSDLAPGHVPDTFLHHADPLGRSRETKAPLCDC